MYVTVRLSKLKFVCDGKIIKTRVSRMYVTVRLSKLKFVCDGKII